MKDPDHWREGVTGPDHWRREVANPDCLSRGTVGPGHWSRGTVDPDCWRRRSTDPDVPSRSEGGPPLSEGSRSPTKRGTSPKTAPDVPRLGTSLPRGEKSKWVSSDLSLGGGVTVRLRVPERGVRTGPKRTSDRDLGKSFLLRTPTPLLRT